MRRPHAVALRATTLLLATLAVAGCALDRERPTPGARGPAPVFVEPRLLPLAGPVSSPEAEISALCWYRDRLVLVPQHPEKYGDDSGTLGFFVLDRADIEAVIDDRRRAPLIPRRAALEATGLLDILPGWDGLEAAAAVDDTVYLAAEACVDGRMAGYLLRGHIVPADEPLRLRIDTERIAPIPVPTNIPNMSQEALVLAPGRVVVLFEANGVNVNPGAHAAVFDRDLEYRGSVPLEHVEYRITAACRPDTSGAFWVINYFFPDEADELKPPARPDQPVEQLLELRFAGEGVVRSDRAPLDLRRDPDLPARNWEALVRLEGRGFLLMTDRYPTTLLAFVPLPGAGERP